MENIFAKSKGWTFKVEIRRARTTAGTFKMSSHLKQGDELVFDKFSVNGMRKRDYYVIEFDLDDIRTRSCLPPGSRVAFWVNSDPTMDPECGDEPPCPSEGKLLRRDLCHMRR